MKFIYKKLKSFTKAIVFLGAGLIIWSAGAFIVLANTMEHFTEIRYQGLSEKHDVSDDYGNAVPQGMAGNGNTIYLLKTKKHSTSKDKDRSYIVKILNANTNSPKLVLPEDDLYVSHGNGMTYYNGCIYIASGDGYADVIYRVKETTNSTESPGYGTEYKTGTMKFSKERISISGINSDEDILNISHYSGDYYIVCLKKNHDGSTNTLTYGVGPISGNSFTIQKRFTVAATKTYGSVQDIDYKDGYLWVVLYKKDSTNNHIHLVELPTSYNAIENGKTYEVMKTVSIDKNEAGRDGTLNELESVYTNGSYFYTWSNIRTGWNETFCRYMKFPDPVSISSITTKSKTSLEIKWNGVGNVNEYRIDRREVGKEFTTIATVDSSKTSYTDTGLTAGTKYYYRVYGKNSAGYSPKKGGVFGVTRTDTPKVSSVTAVSESELKIKWTAVTGAKKYIICRKKEGTGEGWEYYARVAETTATEYTDKGLEPDTVYYYGIIAVTETGVESGSPSDNGNPGSENRLSGKTLGEIKISLNKSSLALAAGRSYKLFAVVTPEYAANNQVVWSGSSNSVVSVDQVGNLTAIESGTAVITATEQMKKKTAQCTVTVYKPDLVLPADLTEIEESAFEGTDAEIVYIPDNCRKIGSNAFRNSGVRQIRIPDDCEIGEEAFAGCEDVTLIGTAGSGVATYANSHGLRFVEGD